MSNNWMIICNRDEIWKEAGFPNLMYYRGIYLDGLRKFTKRTQTVAVPSEIRIGHKPNISQNQYRLRRSNATSPLVSL
jgi:hypothetical protein